MTQIATKLAPTGGIAIGSGTIGSGKAAGVKPGAGGDFAALVAGLGAPGEEAVSADPDALALAGDADAGNGAGTDSETEEGKTGEPVILDLALGAAAQSAMADMVVTPPVQVAAPSAAPVTPESADTGLAGVLATAARMESAVIPMRARAPRGDAAVAPAVLPTASATDTVPTAVAQPAATTGLPTVPGERPAIVSPSEKQSLPIPPARLTATRNATAIVRGQATATTESTASAKTSDGPAQPSAPHEAMAPAMLRQFAALGIPVTSARTAAVTPDAQAATLPTVSGEAGQPIPDVAALLRSTAGVTTPSAASTGGSPLAMPSAVLRQATGPVPTAAASPTPEVAQASGQSVDPSTSSQPAQSIAPAVQGEPLPVDVQVRQGLPLADLAKAPIPTADKAPVAPGEGEAPVATPTALASPATVQPVMSALHRASAAPAEVKSGEAAMVAPMPGEATRRDQGAASNGSSNHESGDNAALASDGAATTAAPADAVPGGRQFADIIQSLPPIAQSRIGIVGDAAPVAAAGPVDVGATLQGQVIDMTVGGQWIDRMAKEITALAQGTGHSRFQLSPPNLGRIQIDVWQGEDGGKVQLLTETDEAARHLRDGQSSLQADARLAALQLNSITIDRAATGFDTPPDQSNQPQQNPRHQQGSEQGSQNGQTATQGGAQGGSQQNGQQGAQAGLQAGMQGGNSNGQGKSSQRRDVLNHQADTVNQQGGTTGRDGERLVRYA